MFLHLSLLAGLLMPVVGYLLPLVLWQLKKNELPGIDAHGKVVANWLLSIVVYSIIGTVLGVFFGLVFALLFSEHSFWRFLLKILETFIGELVPLVSILSLLNILYSIIGGMKANDGVLWPYPLSIRFFK